MHNLMTFAAGMCQDKQFLGLLPWYHYVPLNAQCGFDDPNTPGSTYLFHLLGANSTLILVALAIIDDLLRIAGMVAVGFVIYAGIKYITSQGMPEEAAKAQSTIINALIGLAIALVSIGVVSFLGNQLAGGSGGTVIAGTGVLDLTSLPNPVGTDSGSILRTILGIVFGIIGVMSLLFIVLGGFRYITSQGEARNVTQAKNTILYALIGLAVAILAEAIVSAAVGRL